MELPSIPHNVSKALCCCICKGGLHFDSVNVTCVNCGHTYSIIDAIPDLRAPTPVKLPKIYQDCDYRKWIEFSETAQDYYYQSMIVSKFQNAGHNVIKRLMGNTRYDLVLDLGCGEGAHYPFFKYTNNVFGVDIDVKSLRKLKKRFPDYFVMLGDGYNLPIKDSSISCLVNVFNLEHMAYLDIALEEISRIVNDDGDIFITSPNEGGLAWRAGRSQSSKKEFSDKPFDFERAVQIDHINCIWQLERAFKRHFEIKKRIFYPFFMPSFNFNVFTTFHCKKRKVMAVRKCI